MSTPPPEPDPYEGSGGPDQDDRPDWPVRPAVPGWSAGPSFYNGPVYDDTGWQLDLSGIDWDAPPPEPDYGSEPPRYRRSSRTQRTLRFRHDRPHADSGASDRGRSPDGYRGPPEGDRRRSPDGYRGPPQRDRATDYGRASGPNYQQPPPRDGYDGYGGPADRAADGRGPGYAGYDYPADAPTVRRPRPSGGRHARPAGPGEQPPGPGGRPVDGLRRGPITGPVPGAAQAGTTRSRPGAAPPMPGRLPPAPDGARSGPSGPALGQPDGRRRGPAGAARPPDRGYRGQAGTGTLPPPPVRPPAVLPGGVRPGAPSEPPLSASVARSSGVMAVGTLGSRITGFLRTVVQSYAFGAGTIGVAYVLSNTLPNVVYNLAIGGILTSVIVPLIVNAAKRDGGRGGQGYEQRMFTLVTLALAAVTVVTMALAVPIVHLYSGSQILQYPATVHLSVIFALFFIPQIFFYGVSSLIAAILNARGSFAAPMWTPIINNIVVIAVLGMYVAVAGIGKNASTITGSQVALLGLGTTLGIVAQTIALGPALRRVGFRWQPRIDFRRAEVNEIGRMAGWMLAYVAATQVAYLVTTKIAGDAAKHGAGVVEYQYAWLLFQLPYAVVGISVITALLPRMSFHAAGRQYRLVRQDFSAGTRLAAAIVVPSALVLAALGPDLAEVTLHHGAMTLAAARSTGVAFSFFCLGLLPYMMFQLQLRVFYALHDSKTPAIIGAVTMVVNIVANVVALDVLPRSQVVAGLAVGFGLANLVGTVIAWRILSRRLHGLEGFVIGRSLVRMHAAAVPAALLVVVFGILSSSPVVVVIVGGGLATLVYFLFARALRIDELTNFTQTVMARVRR